MPGINTAGQVCEALNKELLSIGLDPIEDIGDKLRAELLKETEERVNSGEWWFL